MKLFKQTFLLQISAVLLAAYVQAAENGVVPRPGTPGSIDVSDSPPLATLTQPPQDACGTSKKDGGPSIWEIGYRQAMSGTHYKVPILYHGKPVRPDLASCIEFKNGASAENLACCKTGFNTGYRDLQRLIADSMAVPKKPAPETPQAMSCYGAFREGGTAGDKMCQGLTSCPSCCIDIKITSETSEWGCLSLGYLAELHQCKVVREHGDSIRQALSGGALSELTHAPYRGVAGEGSGNATPAGAKASSGLAPDAPGAGDTNDGLPPGGV